MKTMLNKTLQKWANKKQKTIIRWTKEFNALCEKEGIEYNPIISLAFNRDYSSGLWAFNEEATYIINTGSYHEKDSEEDKKGNI